MHATSGWDIATSVGTILGAVATAAAVVVALVLGAKDRRAAERALLAQASAARRRDEREHEVDLLVRLAEQLARRQAYTNAPQAAEAWQIGRALMLALPDVTRMPAARKLLHMPEDASAGRWLTMAQVHGEVQELPDDEYAQVEVADRIKDVASRA